jgi:hypothetical protein
MGPRLVAGGESEWCCPGLSPDPHAGRAQWRSTRGTRIEPDESGSGGGAGQYFIRLRRFASTSRAARRGWRAMAPP